MTMQLITSLNIAGLDIITSLNWILLAAYILFLAYVVLSRNPLGSDPAGAGLNRVAAIFGLVFLVLLLGVNSLPSRWTRLTIFGLLCLPVLLVGVKLIRGLINRIKKTRLDRARADGTDYFSDAPRKQLAQAIATQNLTQVRHLLQSPVPALNEPGKDGMTLLDVAAYGAVRYAGAREPITILSLLRQKGATLESPDSFHVPAYVRLCGHCTPALLAWFLANGANPNAIDPTNEQAPLLFTVLGPAYPDKVEKIRLLLDAGADPNSLFLPQATSWLAGHTIIQAAARQHDWEVCRRNLCAGKH